jgi:IclR family KDG regulon transcriptional repressor
VTGMPMIQAVERALRILDLFDEYDPELKITEVSARMGLHKSTVHSLLKTLQAYHYIEQNPENGKYRLGMKLVERGNFVIHSLDIRTVAKKHLFELSQQTGQTTHLVVLDGKEGVYIDKVEGPHAVIRYSRIGRRIPIHCSAVGKALTAYQSEPAIRSLLSGYTYIQQTPKTITSEQELLAELNRVKQCGYSIDNEENEPGVRCVAAPIFNHVGNAVAAVSMSTLISRIDDSELDRFIPLVIRTGQAISAELGYGTSIKSI